MTKIEQARKDLNGVFPITIYRDTEGNIEENNTGPLLLKCKKEVFGILVKVGEYCEGWDRFEPEFFELICTREEFEGE